jgi:hypothetical protein
MRERLSNRQLVTVVVAICAAAVLAPVSVMAATGSLVNITDPVEGARRARVTRAGTLTVETRAGSRSGYRSGTKMRRSFGYGNLTSTTNPNQLAITELTFTALGPQNDLAQEVLVEAYVRTSGSAGCTGPGTTGYTRHLLRRVLVKNQSTLQLNFNGPPLYLPTGASGQPTCFGFRVASPAPADFAMDVGFTGYVWKE